MPDQPTYNELLATVRDLKEKLDAATRPPVQPLPHDPFAQRPAAAPVRPHATPHDTAGTHTVITETPRQTTIETVNVPPGGQALRMPQAVLKRAKMGKATPEEILAQIASLKTIIRSGVDSAGYGDKRTEFRSLEELRQILGDLEEELEDLLGAGGRIRQIRMTNAWDKGL